MVVIYSFPTCWLYRRVFNKYPFVSVYLCIDYYNYYLHRYMYFGTSSMVAGKENVRYVDKNIKCYPSFNRISF